MTLAGLKIVKPGTGDAPGGSRCKKPEFAAVPEGPLQAWRMQEKRALLRLASRHGGP